MADGDEMVTIRIEVPDGTSDEITLPSGLIELLADDTDTTPEIIGDVAIMAFAGRAHAVVHHSETTIDEETHRIEELMMGIFEDRFGVTYSDAMDHEH